MSAYPSQDDVVEDLGSKVTEGFVKAISDTADDLAKYRETHPEFVSRHSDRGLANWIHDMMWYNLTQSLYDVSEVSIVDKEPIRELFVGTRYRLRAKRHSEDGQVSSHETDAMIDFMEQSDTLPGLELVRLIVGYQWLKESNSIGEPVLSLRDGKDNVVWQAALSAGSGGVAVLTPLPVQPGPDAPQIDTSRIAPEQTGEETNPA